MAVLVGGTRVRPGFRTRQPGSRSRRGLPDDTALVSSASGLVFARWALLAAVIVVALIVNIMVVRRKLNDFAQGKLPGQKPHD